MRFLLSFRFLSILSVCFLFTRCSDSPTNPVFSGGANFSPVTVSGVVQLGRVGGASVSFYQIKDDGTRGDLIGTTTSNARGEFSYSMAPASKPVLVLTSGGTYVDEATGSTKSGIEMSSVLEQVAQDADAPVTLMTTIVKERALEQVANGSKLSEVLSASKNEVAALFGLESEDITVLPSAPDSLSGTTRQIKAAFALATFSHLYHRNFAVQGAGHGLNDIVTAIVEDFKKDGKLDGKASAGQELSDALSNRAKKIASGWSQTMAEARDLAKVNSRLGFKDLDSNVQGQLSAAVNTGSAVSGSFDGAYYIGGVQTDLPESGTGFWNGVYYTQGQETARADGYVAGRCYHQGLANVGDIDASGTGYCDSDGIFYISGVAYPGLGLDGSGVSGGIQYSCGQIVNGIFQGRCYSAGIDTEGVTNGTGYCSFDSTYYLSGNPAPGLNSDGTGILASNGKYYVGGVLANGVTGISSVLLKKVTSPDGSVTLSDPLTVPRIFPYLPIENGSTNMGGINTELSFDGAFTLETWAKLNDTSGGWFLGTPSLMSGWQHFEFGIAPQTSGSFTFSYGTYYGNWMTREYYDQNISLHTGYSPGAGEWHHYAVSRDTNFQWRIFIDGVDTPFEVSASHASFQPDAVVAIPDFWRIQNLGPRGLNGALAGFRITKGKSRYNSSFSPPSQDFSNPIGSNPCFVNGVAISTGTCPADGSTYFEGQLVN